MVKSIRKDGQKDMRFKRNLTLDQRKLKALSRRAKAPYGPGSNAAMDAWMHERRRQQGSES
jgi:hypothetical protein